MDGKAYIASLDDGRRVYADGQRVGDIASHPHFAGTVARIAATYDHFDRNAEAKARFFTPPSDAEGMRAHAAIHTDGATHTTHNALMTLLTAADRIAEARPQGRDAILAYVQYVRDNDLRVVECITDAKGDRSKPPALQEDKDAYLRVVERRPDGVVIRGAKLHISLTSVSHEMMVIPTKGMKPGEEDYAIACAVPVNAPGVSVVDVINGAPPEGADPRDFPFAFEKAVPQGFVIFDDVFVPNERIFLDGEVKQAATFAHSLGLWVRASSMISLCDGFDLMIGLAQLIAEANGLEKIEHIKLKIAEMIITATLVRATLEASMVHAKKLDNGALAPDEVYTNAGKYHAAANYGIMVRNLMDIAGGSVITAPSMRDLENAEIGHLVRKYMGTKQSVDGTYRTRLFHAIHDITASAQGGAKQAGLLLSGGGLYAQNVVTRGRYDMARAKAMALEAIGLAEAP
ncbi:4-hydroxyphenylacetate 3-hydroxylase N-terminal domain-containing protein [Novosphingobium bradum]|uniref:4-hydroxyphenylacetate 3-hydroxylase N-terminal domain-containing protein n=1 Tax=Novosphingobium bradum TaxID=1737444 RepID=A0ABV7IN41_9SPHN